jgi:hypothetical protein
MGRKKKIDRVHVSAPTTQVLTRHLLTVFYETHNPSKINDVDMILMKISKNVYSVQQVVDICIKKYGNAPTVLQIDEAPSARAALERQENYRTDDSANKTVDGASQVFSDFIECNALRLGDRGDPSLLLCGEARAKVGLSWAWASWAAWVNSIKQPLPESEELTITAKVVETAEDSRWRYTTERDCLVRLFLRNNGCEWRNTQGWCDPFVVDDWHGVETDRCGSVCRLNFYNQGLLDLNGFEVLQHLQILESLSLFGNDDLTSLEPLSGLVQLKTLNLYKCKRITELSPLSGMKGLVALDLRYCKEVTEEERSMLQEKLPGLTMNSALYPT